MLWTISTYTIINNNRLHHKKIKNDSMECASEQTFISGQNQPDNQPGHRLQLS